MRPTLLQIILRSIGLLIAAGIQIYSGYWNLLFRQRIDQLLFDSTTLGIATIETALSVVSGMLIYIILVPRSVQTALPKLPDVVLAVAVLLPTIAVTIKGIAAVTGFGLFPMVFMPVWDWAIYSQTASIWLGIALVTLIYHFRNDSNKSKA